MTRRSLWLIVAFIWLAAAVPARAVGTVTTAHRTVGNIRTITLTVTADASAATVPDTALPAFEGRLLAIETNPGTTAPTDDYDITVIDAHGFDVLQGVGANRDTANTEKAAIVFSSTSVHPVIDEADALTFKIANNAVNSATIVVVIYYALGAG